MTEVNVNCYSSGEVICRETISLRVLACYSNFADFPRYFLPCISYVSLYGTVEHPLSVHLRLLYIESC